MKYGTIVVCIVCMLVANRSTEKQPAIGAYYKLYGIATTDPDRYDKLLARLKKTFLPFRIVRGQDQVWPKSIRTDRQLIKTIHRNALPKHWTELRSREKTISSGRQ